MATDERRVHARDRHVEVVRYERRGHWYIEALIGGQRDRVTVAAAARRASVTEKWGGRIYFGLPGGATFDRKVRTLLAETPAR